MTRAKTAQIILVGGGRMGSAFARSLEDSRVPFELVRARDPSWTIGARRRRARLLLLTVTDSAIASTAERVASEALVARGDSVVHCAGMRGPAELVAASSVGAWVGAMHPLVAVASAERPPSLRGLSASFEGDRGAFDSVCAMGARLGLSVFWLEGVDRPRYHAAAALCATGGVALAQAAAVLFRAAASSSTTTEDSSSRFASSLLASVAHNVGAVGAADALASPLLRGDTQAVSRHLEAMALHPPAAALYRAALAQVIASLDERGGVDSAVLARARALLDG